MYIEAQEKLESILANMKPNWEGVENAMTQIDDLFEIKLRSNGVANNVINPTQWRRSTQCSVDA